MEGDIKIKLGAKAIAEDLRIPEGGTKKLARIVADHLDWFDAVEARGLTWLDVIRVLTAAGAVGRGGRPFKLSTLYSAVTRKRAEAHSGQQMGAKATGPGRNRPSRPANTAKVAQRRAGTRLKQKAPDSHPIRTSDSDGAKSNTKKDAYAISAHLPPESENTAASSNNDALAFMKRAAAIRKRSSDD